jgi:hypothetical protein
LLCEGDKTIELHKELNIVMESTSKPMDELKDPRKVKVTNGKRKRGISAWACAYKARNWTLESSKDSSKPKANATKECEPKANATKECEPKATATEECEPKPTTRTTNA